MEPSDLERVWGQHVEAEFGTRDVEAALATMVEDASVDHVPVGSGGQGKAVLRGFYRDEFIPSWPHDVEIRPRNRVVGSDQLVDELRVSFTHSQPMDWFLPGVAPTNHRIEIDIVIVVEFRDGRIAAERIYWDHASVLRQIGVLVDPEPAQRGQR